MNYLLESDQEEYEQLEYENDGNSSTDSEYNDDDNFLSIATNVPISGSD